VNFEEIVLSLNKNNISRLFSRLSLSKCPKARKLVKKLVRGEDFYDSLADFFDPIGAEILALRNFTAIQLLQQYLLLKRRLIQQLKSALLYPMILLFVQGVLFLVISNFLKINWFYIVFIFLSNILIFLVVYFYLKGLQRNLLLFYLFENLLDNKLGYEGFRRCCLLFYDSEVNVFEFSDINDLSRAYLGIPYINRENFLEQKTLQQEKIKNFLKKIPKLVVAIISINVAMLCIFVLFAYVDFLNQKMPKISVD
jgi:hypothetical protein